MEKEHFKSSYLLGLTSVKKITTIILGCGLLGLEAVELQAQNNTIASGGEATGSGGSVSYSVGQVVYTTNTGTNGSVAQGVQQPYEIYTVGIEETDIQYYLTAFPNPTTDNLKLKVDILSSEMYYQLFDIQGKLLENKIIISNETTISMASFVSAIYFLKIIANNKEVKQFKIIKN